MNKLDLLTGNKLKKSRILCLGAHPDDIEIGCGGTILRLLGEYPDIDFRWIVFSADEQRKKEAIKSAAAFLKNRRDNIIVEDFKEGFFPYIGYEIKEYFEEIKKTFQPDIIFTHFRNDLHQDHRLISELTWNTFRNHFICEYEIPKYDGDFGTPNFFVSLNAGLCKKKIGYLMKFFKTQQQKQWFGDDLFRAILRLRGIEANAPEKYAEAFYCRKMVW